MRNPAIMIPSFILGSLAFLALKRQLCQDRLQLFTSANLLVKVESCVLALSVAPIYFAFMSEHNDLGHIIALD